MDMHIMFAIPIGIIYNLMIDKMTEIVGNQNSNHKQQTSFAIAAISVIVGLSMAFIVFGQKPFKNDIIKYGLIIGSILLFINNIVFNWEYVDNIIKFGLFGGGFLAMVVYAYKAQINIRVLEKKKKLKNLKS